MATKLKNMKLTSVDLVRAGANQEADICLYKSADATEPAGGTTDHDKSLLKRFLDWMRENHAEAHREPQEEPTEKKEYQLDEHYAEETLDLYIETLEDSIESILRDPRIDASKKAEVMQQSLQEFTEAMEELIPDLCGITPKKEERPKTEEEVDVIEETT